MDNRLIFLYFLFSLKSLDRFRIGGVPKGTRLEKFMDGNHEKFTNPLESAKSRSQ